MMYKPFLTMNTTSNPHKTGLRKWIIAISIVIPIAVAALFGIKIEGVDFSFLPPIYASINGITALLLILALIFIKNGKVQLHQKTIQVALALSVLFLLCYVAYHMTSDSTLYGDLDANGKLDEIELNSVQSSRLAYIILLLSHISLSVAVVPVVLFTYLHAWEGNYQKHKKWAKFAFPIWLYVAVTGVIVYLMISPYYPH
jgi:putative membrane protein